MLTKTRRYGLPGNPATLPALLLAGQLPANHPDPVCPPISATLGHGIESALGFVSVSEGPDPDCPGQRIVVGREDRRLASNGAGAMAGYD